MKKNDYYYKVILILISFMSYLNYFAFSKDNNILSNEDLYEIAETISFVSFQQIELQELNYILDYDIIVAKMNNLDIKDRILCIYRNLLYKNSNNYNFKIDTIDCSIINNIGLSLFDSFYFSKNICGDEKGFSHRFKIALDKYGKFYRLYGFGNNVNDFELIYQKYINKLKSITEVYELINFYISNVLLDRTEGKFVIIDSSNINKYNKYYNELVLNIIKKEDDIWIANINILLYIHGTSNVEIHEYNFLFNEKERKFTFNDKLIKKYKNIKEE